MAEKADYEVPVQDVHEVNLDWTPVESSNIAEVGYNPSRAILGVKFNFGTTYYYYGVEPGFHVDMIAAESVGKYFHRFIKGKFAYGKLGD